MIGISFCLIIVRLGDTEQRFSLPALKTADFVIATMETASEVSQDDEGRLGAGARNPHPIP
jgi:hypothetical protein